MEHTNVLIIGAGISGIGAGCHLRMKNPDKDFIILEGRDTIGGTWDLFRYPGVRSDSDMFTFGYTFKPWVKDRDIATGASILEYLEETVDEYGLRDDIRFGHRVTKLSWSTPEQRWVATVERHDGEVLQISCDFLISGTGYYRYAHGYMPEFDNLDAFQGPVIHPQQWPEDLDYTGKRVVVIGSGATAVTIVPAMAKKAEHVTMLQRSPTYIFSRPAEDAIAKALRFALPSQAAYQLTRLKNIGYQWLTYKLARWRPEKIRENLREMAIEELGPDIDVDTHFNPDYNPWDQRLCLIPDGDLYASLREGNSTIVTDTIDHFTEDGVQLASGDVLKADIIVPATGLVLEFMEGVTMEVDGRVIEGQDLINYRGVMFANIPNWAALFGYTAASWTLKIDLAADYISRLLTYMDEHNYATVAPVPEDKEMETIPLMANLGSASYVQRSKDRMPRQGTEKPWSNPDNYLTDYISLKFSSFEDGVLTYEPPRPPLRAPKKREEELAS